MAEAAAERAHAEELGRMRMLEAMEKAKKNRAMDMMFARQGMVDRYQDLQTAVAANNAIEQSDALTAVGSSMSVF